MLLDTARGLTCARYLVHFSLRSRSQTHGGALSTNLKSASRSLSITTTANTTPKSRVEPRASNPLVFQRNFFDPEAYHLKSKTHRKRLTADRPLLRRAGGTQPQRSRQKQDEQRLFPISSNTWRRQILGEHLLAQSDISVPSSTWVQVEGISPISTLDAILAGIQKALNVEEKHGIINLDALWSRGEPIPCLPRQQHETVYKDKWVRKAKLILSPFGRPTGWYLQFDNRSVVYALLMHAQHTPVFCTWKAVKIKEYKGIGAVDEPINNGNFVLNERVSDHTLRVENCPANISETSLLNFFTRFDLQCGDAVQRWEGVTSDGKKAPPTTFLVHFADASWARAALREKQSLFMRKYGCSFVADEKNPQPLRLVQYPRQMT